MPVVRMSDLELSGKRVLIREDLNVPVDGGKVTSDARIRASLPTIRAALEAGAARLLGHAGGAARRGPAGGRGGAAGGALDAEPIEITTDDYGCILFKFVGGGRGSLHVSQITAGRKMVQSRSVPCRYCSARCLLC